MKIKGVELRVTPASFELADELQNEVMRALEKSDITLDTEIDANILNPLLSVAGSKEIKKLLFECCKTVLFGEETVNKDFFEKVENRELFYPIMIEVMRVNLLPFFQGLLSQFQGGGGILESIMQKKTK
jgi:hypothetical protein